jgi:hypothetical protein
MGRIGARGHVASPELRTLLTAFRRQHGIIAASKLLGVAPATLDRMIAGQTVQEGSLSLVITKLSASTEARP